MQVLRKNGFPVPEPMAQSRHTIVMELVDAFPLRQIQSVPDPAGLYAELIDVILRLAGFGLIHGDFNEFNILIKESEILEKPHANGSDGREVRLPEAPDDTSTEAKRHITLTPVIIDFPQMVSIDHTNAAMYFERDVNCIKRFFERKFNFVSDEAGPHYADARKLAAKKNVKRLDVEIEASGFSKKMAKELERYMRDVGVDGDRGHDGDDGVRQDFEDDETDELPNESHDVFSKDIEKS